MACSTIISAVGASLFLASAGPDTRVVIGTEDSFPPYVVRDSLGHLDGFEVAIMTEICSRNAFDCSWQTAPFAELIPGVIEGRFDVVLGGMAITEERRRMVDFSQPYTFAGAYEWFVGLSGAAEPSAARIAVEAGTIHEAWLRQEGLNFQSYGSEVAALSAVAEGKADLAFGPFTQRADLSAHIEGRGLDHLYEVEVPDEGTGMALCKGNEPLLSQINSTLDAMTEDGTLGALNDRWFQ